MSYSDAMNSITQGLEQGLVSQTEVEALNKALSAGYGGAGRPTDLVYGGVLQTESLETTLKVVTFDMKNLKLWPALSIDKAYNLFEQYNRIVGYGSDSSPYIGEGGAGQEEDSTYIRDGQRIAFFSKRRKVSHQMTLVRTTVGDVVAQQAKEGTMDLLKNVERELYWGHAHFVDASGAMTGSNSDLPVNSLAMNGLLQQIMKGDSDSQFISKDFEGWGAETTSVLKDMAGSILAQDDVEEMAVRILENFGQPGSFHAEPIAISAFVRQFYPMFRSEPGLSNQSVGYDVSKITTTAGVIDLKPNLFLRPRAGVRPAAVNASCPSVAGLTVAGTHAGSGSALAAGSYHYAVTLVNDFGESAPILTAAPVLPLAGEEVTVAITGALPAGVKYIKIFRAANGAAAHTAQFIGNYRVGLSAMKDIGTKKPGLGEAFMLDLSADCMKFKQLSPLARMNLAVVTTALEFLILLYGALFVYSPRWNAVFRNLGK
jgi:hypothetical protein